MQRPNAARLVNGWLEVLSGGYQVKSVAIQVGGAIQTTVVPAVPGRKIRVLGYRLQARASNPATGIIALVDGAGGAWSQNWDLNPREGCVVNSGQGTFEFETGVGERLTTVQGDAAHAFSVTVIYIEV